MNQLTDSDTTSADLVTQNVAQVKTLFPEAFAEGKIDFNVLRQLLGDAVEDSDEKYGLNWHGKKQARRLALTPSTGTLRPCPEESVDWNSTQNLMIEGDNLEVLKLLLKSYAGKVKLIYIDPPYNTGKDFIYPDDFKDTIKNYLQITAQVDGDGQRLSSNTDASGRFHTNALNMLYPRIKVARNLLSESGIMVVSTSQTELSNLQKIMDEVFGEENLFAILTRRAMHTVRNTSKDFNLHADYHLVYAKRKDWFGEHKQRYIRKQTDKSASYPLDDNDGRGAYKLDPLHARNYYTPYRHTFENGVTWEPPEGSFPRYSIKTLTKMEKDNRLVFNGEPKAKRYLNEVQEGQPPDTILAPEDVGFNSDGTRELRETLGADKVFSQPKPTRLIEYFLQLTDDPNAIVLDFFSGSGTTGHAVLSRNVEDGGARRHIQIQLPEPLDPRNKEQRTAIAYLDSIDKPRNISEITKERLRRAARLIKSAYEDQNVDLGFRVFRLDSSNIKTWEPNPIHLEQSLMENIEHIKPGRSDQDILSELILKRGLDLCDPITMREIAGKPINAVGDGKLIACLAQKIKTEEVDELANGLADWHDILDNTEDNTVIFRDSAFADDVAKTNCTEILRQRGIMNVYSI